MTTASVLGRFSESLCLKTHSLHSYSRELQLIYFTIPKRHGWMSKKTQNTQHFRLYPQKTTSLVSCICSARDQKGREKETVRGGKNSPTSRRSIQQEKFHFRLQPLTELHSYDPGENIWGEGQVTDLSPLFFLTAPVQMGRKCTTFSQFSSPLTITGFNLRNTEPDWVVLCYLACLELLSHRDESLFLQHVLGF